MVLYRERLWAAPWLYISTALVIPASLIVFAPINFTAGVIVAIVLYAGCVGMLLASAPLIEVSGDSLRAGRASIPLQFIGEPHGYGAEDAVLERGQRLDARAWLLIRGWIKPVVKVPILDASDPAPYWLLSTRSPDRLVRALGEARRSSAKGDADAA
ncbi:DUF3093 domain-containing protein [Leifsonia sp. Root112D2]|jgi:hypothetical protein|uniref:DUF3093 domain-containing protein n=1 Tax=Leifsonia sp. Root112D2 TaxID=1736426 RepID=UPI0006F48099|nr:DUF3093 domain-containing protein [Leifsonia sp. Root112D2]KQV08001.1 hypothetical protein ASC63_12625 [Leifsonia sp. Root112D2]